MVEVLIIATVAGICLGIAPSNLALRLCGGVLAGIGGYAIGVL
jgi:hypothetical protein